MARRKLKNRKRRAYRKKNDWLNVFIGFAPYVFSFGLLGCLLGGSYAYAVQSDLFVLRNVVIENYRTLSARERFQFAGLTEGESLLAIPLDSVEEYVRRYHPEYQEVQVERILPNDIRVVLTKRLPVARVRLDKMYWIDHNGVILSPTDLPKMDYPMVYGVPKPKVTLTTGSRIHYPALDRAVKLLQDIEKRDILKAHDLNYIDISDMSNIVLRMDQTIEVRLGKHDLAAKLSKLREAIESLNIEAKRVRYIDLRFDDVVIGPR